MFTVKYLRPVIIMGPLNVYSEVPETSDYPGPLNVYSELQETSDYTGIFTCLQ